MRPFAALILIAVLSSCAENGGEPGNRLPWPEDSLYSLVVRTDFSDDDAWSRVRSLIEKPVSTSVGGVTVGEFRPAVEWVDDRRFEQLTVDRLVALARDAPSHPVVFIVDHETLVNADHPVLAIDLMGKPGRTFRVIPAEMWNVQSNLAIANVDWEDFADYTDADGVFRGLPR